MTQAKAKYDATLLKLSATEAELRTVSNENEQKEELTKMLRAQVDQLTNEGLNHRQELDDVKVLLVSVPSLLSFPSFLSILLLN